MRKLQKKLNKIAEANGFTCQRKMTHGDKWVHVNGGIFSMGGTPRNKTYYAINVIRNMRKASGDNTIPYI